MKTTGFQFQKRTDIVLILSFASVYILWGSTYLALRFALETLPPFLMASFRFLLAGSIMLFFAKMNNHVWPTKKEIKNAAYVGILLLVIGNGGVVWAEQDIESGITALIVTIEPVWVVLLMWLRSKENKPSFMVSFGILIGLIGIVLLINPISFGSIDQLNPLAVVALLLSSISWAIGSVYALHIKLPSSAAMSTGFQMFIAGIVLLFIATLNHDWQTLDIDQISTNSLLGFLYLVVFGSLIGFSAYSYLVKNTSPMAVSTYAFVNPIVAVFLGWWIGNELLGVNTLNAALLLITAVALIITKPKINPNWFSLKIKW